MSADELELILPEADSESESEGDYSPPAIGTPGRILVEVWPHDMPGTAWEYEVLAYDKESSVYWIEEGVGFDWWLSETVGFPAPGLYVILNIKGEWIKPSHWENDDGDELWECSDPIAITPEEAKALGFTWENEPPTQPIVNEAP